MPSIRGAADRCPWPPHRLDGIGSRHHRTKSAEELARQQQEALQFTARLVTMGEMASTLAHELNQPLAAIASYNTGCLNLLADGKFDPDESAMPWKGRRPGPAGRPHRPPG